MRQSKRERDKHQWLGQHKIRETVSARCGNAMRASRSSKLLFTPTERDSVFIVGKILIEGTAKDSDNIIEVNCVIGVAGGNDFV